MQGLSENGRFYYGARPRMTLPTPEPTPSAVQPIDPDAPDEVNARRFFGFTDTEEICPVLLRSRYIDRRNGSAARIAAHYYQTLNHR